MAQSAGRRDATDPHNPRIAIVVSRYNASVTDRLRDGALSQYAQRFPRTTEPGVVLIDAPGAFELPALALGAALTGRFEGVVALGCLIKGETSHDRYIAQAVAQGLVQVTIATGVPVAFGVLTVDTPQQARERAGGKHGNKGQEAMSALLDTIDQLRILKGVGAARGVASRRQLRDKARSSSAPKRGRA